MGFTTDRKTDVTGGESQVLSIAKEVVVDAGRLGRNQVVVLSDDA